MHRLILPIIILFGVLLSGYSIIHGFHSRISKDMGTLAKQREKAATLMANNRAKSAEIAAVRDDIARGRDFLNDWQIAQTRSSRGGVENTIMEIASTQEVSIPTPRVEGATDFLTSEVGPIAARNIHVQGDGNISGLLRFFSETERSLPLAQTLSLALRAGDREPKIEFTFAMLEREFAPMPELPADAPAPDSTGVFAIRPDTSKPIVPSLPDNLVARGLPKPTVASNTPSTELSKILPGLKITGMIWDSDRQKRALLANGYILRPGVAVPSVLVKAGTSARVILIEVGRDLARFKIETEVYNSVTSKHETESVTRELQFTIFNELTPEG